jgi:regulatory protein
MKITAIKQQIKRTDRYSIYGDGKYLFSFSEGELLSSGIKIGQEIDEVALNVLRNKAVIDKAYDRALNLISRRIRSEWELQDYLKRKDYDEDVRETVVNRLRERGYVDDEEFAKRWVANRRLLKATSKRRLTQELRQKRISDEIIKTILDADETNEHALLLEIIERKRKQTKYLDDQKLVQYLIRQGFNYNQIKSALTDQGFN